MPAYILRQRDCLIAHIESVLTDTEIEDLHELLLQGVARYRARGVIVDVTALDVIDSFVSRALSLTARANELQGATTVVIGIRPEIAAAMSHVGFRLDPVVTALDFDAALALLELS